MATEYETTCERITRMLDKGTITLRGAVLYCSLDMVKALAPEEVKGCDGCNRDTLATPIEDAGYGWAVVYDTNGDPDVGFCPLCQIESQ